LSARTPRGCIFRALTLYGVFVFSTWLLWLLLGHLAGWWMSRREERAWAATGMSMEALRARAPRHDDSAAAHELERLTDPLGVHVIRLPGRDSQIKDRPLYDAMVRFMGGLSKTGDDRYDAAPPEVRAFLDRHRAELVAVAAHFSSAPDIAWEMDIDMGPEAPIPSLLAHRHLNTLLLIEALERRRRGDDAGAGQMLDAARRHAEALAGRPERISQLIAIALAGQQGDVLRRVSGGTGPWDARLQQRRYHQDMLDGFQYEAYSWLVLNKTYRGVADLEVSKPPPTGPLGWLVRISSAPYVQVGFSGISRHLRRAREIARSSDPCRMPGDELEKKVSAGIPRWDVLSTIAVPSVMRTVTSAAGADLDNELTRLVLQARSGGPAGGAAPLSVKSRICEEVSWRHERRGDGRWTIKADPNPSALDPNRPQRWAFTFAAVRRR
jgi:hypothetical protein